MFDILVGSHTDIGDVKQTNQDCILCRTGVFGKNVVGLFIVADGCGGLSFGEEISKLAVTHFNRLWDTDLKEIFDNKKATDKDIGDLLEKAIIEINNNAIEFGKQVGKQVGTTLSLLLVVGKQYFIKNVGDSRVYLIRKGKLQQLTEDQSLVARMLRNKELTLEEAKNFGKKNVLTMCIGLFADVKTYTKTGTVKSGDSFLLCCDGLYNFIPEDTFDTLLTQRKKMMPDILVKALREGIPQGNAKDNVSAVFAIFKKKRTAARVVIITIIALLIILAIGSVVFYDQIAQFVFEKLIPTIPDGVNPKRIL